MPYPQFWILIVAAIALVTFSSSNIVHAQGGKCKSIQQLCAIEIGGFCDPKTGQWAYGNWQGRPYGGNSVTFNNCITQKSAGGKQKR